MICGGPFIVGQQQSACLRESYTTNPPPPPPPAITLPPCPAHMSMAAKSSSQSSDRGPAWVLV